MAKQNRETLKRFFSAGKLPSEEHFADLIDSSLNVTDEGFSKSEDFGFEVKDKRFKKSNVFTGLPLAVQTVLKFIPEDITATRASSWPISGMGTSLNSVFN